MAKKSTAQKVKDLVSGKLTPKAQNASKAPPSPEKGPSENFTTGIQGKKKTRLDPDSVAGKLESRLKAKGLTLKVEAAHHLNVTVIRETDVATTQISTQVGENLVQSEADFLYDRAINELLGGV